MNTKPIVLILVILLMVVSLPGCQTTTQTTNPPPTEIPVQNTSVPPSATPASTDTPEPAPTETPILPTPTFTAQPERSVESLDELVGIWKGYWSDVNMIFTEFLDTSQAKLTWERGGLINTEWFTFENGLLTWGKITFAESNPQECWDNPEATYKVYITFRGEEPEKLRFVLEGEDHCYDRQEFYDGKTFTWVGTKIP
jgi:hypothetical protein